MRKDKRQQSLWDFQSPKTKRGCQWALITCLISLSGLTTQAPVDLTVAWLGIKDNMNNKDAVAEYQ